VAGSNSTVGVDLSEIRQRLETLHQQRKKAFGNAILSSWLPLCDIWENDDTYLISVELPGTGVQDLNIEIRASILIISGEKRKDPEGEHKFTEVRRESKSGPFQRAFKLPQQITNTEFNQWLEDGILTICFAKTS
jgi:HSP20 family protein